MKKHTLVAIGLLLLVPVARAATNTANYTSPSGDISITATLTVPDDLGADTDFVMALDGEYLHGGGASMFKLYRDAEWHYDSAHKAVVTSGELVIQDLFFFGALDKDVTLNLPAGTYTYTLVWGRSFAHRLGNVAVDLEFTVVELPTPVDIDIKPTSCPNPLNVNSGGVVSVAILGSADFDVSDVDAATVTLAGVPALRWNTEDAASPVANRTDPCDCTTAGADGYTDLVLKFDKKDLVAAVGDVVNGEVIHLTLEGDLNDGSAIEGTDCMVVRKNK